MTQSWLDRTGRCMTISSVTHGTDQTTSGSEKGSFRRTRGRVGRSSHVSFHDSRRALVDVKPGDSAAVESRDAIPPPHAADCAGFGAGGAGRRVVEVCGM